MATNKTNKIKEVNNFGIIVRKNKSLVTSGMDYKDMVMLKFSKPSFVPIKTIKGNKYLKERYESSVNYQKEILKGERKAAHPHYFPEAFKKLAKESKKDTIYVGLEWETFYTGQWAHGVKEKKLEDRHYDSYDWPKKFLVSMKEHIEPLLPYFNFRMDGAACYEMVSIPSSVSALKKILDEKFFSTPLTIGMAEHPFCGVHVHIARASFKNNYHLLSLAWFLNNPDNKDFLVNLAGREENGCCQKVDMKPIYDKKTKKIVAFNGVRFREVAITQEVTTGNNTLLRDTISTLDYYNDRRDETSSFPSKSKALNTSKNATVEIRMFASPDCKEKLYYRLEFVEAVMLFTKHIKEIDECTVENFTKFVFKSKLPQAKNWDNLKNYLAVTH